MYPEPVSAYCREGLEREFYPSKRMYGNPEIVRLFDWPTAVKFLEADHLWWVLVEYQLPDLGIT